MQSRLAVLALLLLSVTACGKEVGRVRMPAEGSGAASLTLQEGEVSFWTDLDISYEGDATLEYKIEVYQDGSNVGKIECNPLGNLPSKTSWVETNIGKSHSRRGSGKMTCEMKLPKTGETTIKTSLAFGKRPEKLVLKKADLVIKQ
jgi:hypothetical protein